MFLVRDTPLFSRPVQVLLSLGPVSDFLVLIFSLCHQPDSVTQSRLQDVTQRFSSPQSSSEGFPDGLVLQFLVFPCVFLVAKTGNDIVEFRLVSPLFANLNLYFALFRMENVCCFS